MVKKIVFGAALAVALAALMAPTGGMPSRPRFQSVGILSAAPTGSTALRVGNGTRTPVNASQRRVVIDHATASERAAYIALADAAGTPVEAQFEANGTSGLIVAGSTSNHPVHLRSNNVDAVTISTGQVANFANMPTVASVPMVTTESGEFTATFDTACTTDHVQTFDWIRVGNQVTIIGEDAGAGVCTSDSTSFLTTGTPVPASIRPAYSQFSTPIAGFQNNSAATWAVLVIAPSGALTYNRCATFGADCTTTGWTAALNKRSAGGVPVSYILTNP